MLCCTGWFDTMVEATNDLVQKCAACRISSVRHLSSLSSIPYYLAHNVLLCVWSTLLSRTRAISVKRSFLIWGGFSSNKDTRRYILRYPTRHALETTVAKHSTTQANTFVWAARGLAERSTTRTYPMLGDNWSKVGSIHLLTTFGVVGRTIRQIRWADFCNKCFLILVKMEKMWRVWNRPLYRFVWAAFLSLYKRFLVEYPTERFKMLLDHRGHRANIILCIQFRWNSR